MKTVFLSLLISWNAFAGSSPRPWYDRVRALADEAAGNQEKILAELRADKTLEARVCKSIKERRYLAEAFQAVLRLHFQSCWKETFQSAVEDHEWLAVIALQELNKEKPRPEWPKWLKDTLTGEAWSSIDGANKLVVLSAAAQEKIQLTPAQLKVLLKDEDTEVRESALQLVFKNVEAGENESREILRHSLGQDPLQFRLAAYHLVGRLPASARAQFKNEIDRCVKSETEHRVKVVCEKLQSSR